MKYDEIVQAALTYSDRQDEEVINAVPLFIKVVETQVNRILKIGKMTSRVIINTQEGQQYYGLPEDFIALRDIEIQDTVNNTSNTPTFVTPEKFNQLSNTDDTTLIYSIIDNQLQINPPQEYNLLELVYYKKLLPLSAINDENWLSMNNPDVYIFGLLTEINAFVKDAESASLWGGRFKGVLAEIDIDDELSRWSGPSMKVQLT